MGKYSSVNVSAITGTIADIQSIAEANSNADGEIGGFRSGAITNIRSAIKKVYGSGCNGSLGNLKNNLKDLNNVCQKISEYQEIEKEIKELEPQVSYRVDSGYYQKDEDGNYALNKYGKRIWVKTETWVTDREKEKRLNYLKNKLELLEKQIDGM